MYKQASHTQYPPPPGFHSAALYPLLQHAVAPLVTLLRDPEDKMRANAAGALGNFVRNGSMLCGQLRAAGALQGLLQLVAQGAPAYVQGAPEGNAHTAEGSSPLKVSLFSLGNMCTHRECAQELLMLNVRGVIAPLATSDDATVRRYVQRIEVVH